MHPIFRNILLVTGSVIGLAGCGAVAAKPDTASPPPLVAAPMAPEAGAGSLPPGSPPPPPSARSARGGIMAHDFRHGAASGAASGAANLEQRIKSLHDKLMITPAQQPQWDRFAQVMRENDKAREAEFHQRLDTLSKMNAVDNMQSYAQLAMAHAQDVEKLVPAFQEVYESLSDRQKQIADQVFRHQDHRGEHKRPE